MINRILISDEEQVVSAAVSNKIENVMVDLEVEGKMERQGHVDAHFTTHNLNSVENVRAWLTTSETKLLVRCNPISSKSSEEIENIIRLGADLIMLPMYRCEEEVRQFKEIIDNRVPVVLLAETRDSILNFDEVSRLLSPNDRVHFGLNDLSLEFGFDFLFDVLKSRLLDGVCNFCRESNIDFGIGGIGTPLVESIISPNYILNEHIRLGSNWVILSRAFRNNCILDGQFNSKEFTNSLLALSELDSELRNAK